MSQSKSRGLPREFGAERYLLQSAMADIGKHFIVALQGSKLTDAERALWKELRPLGTIVFKRNVPQGAGWQQQLRDTLTELRELSGRQEFIASIDHEGGRVHRLFEPVTHFPAAALWSDLSYEVGAAMGSELSDLGFNLNYAPSMDVLVEPRNTVIGNRSFSSNAEEVTKQSLKFLDGMEAHGVLGVAKHFPGHGATVEDSHRELPRLQISKETLEHRELLPFKAYIESGRKLIMTAHIVFEALDPENPATLSTKILRDLLRGELGYDGAIITDALDMSALAAYSEAEVAAKFIRAGGDLFCVCQDTNDKFNQGVKLSPIQSALRYAEALTNNSELQELLAESHRAIERFLKTLRFVEKSADRLQNVNYAAHAALKESIQKTAQA